MLGLVWIVYKTKPGLGMRAISKDIETSYIMGVPVNRIISLTFGIGSALAAASGIMWALRYPQLQPVMGSIPGFKAFIAAVFGGIGSIPGAVVGGVMLGVIEIMAVAFFPDLAGYRDAFAFFLLIVILLDQADRSDGRTTGGQGLMRANTERSAERPGRARPRALHLVGGREPRRLQHPDPEPDRGQHHPGAQPQPDLRLHGSLQPGPRRLHGDRRLRLLDVDPRPRAEGDALHSRAGL